jgi:NitT/TauT family transport system substrate-binding protein
MNAVSNPAPILRAGFEGSGSPRWLMRTMQRAGFDRAHGFALDLKLLSEGKHRHGTLQALADGRVDVVDADRQALAAAQADGLALAAIHPYGRILGSVVSRHPLPDQLDRRLAALRGSRLGVLSTDDKNWHLLAEACRELAGFDLATTVTAVRYQQRTDLVAALAAGEVDAALVHWHLVPQLLASGHQVLAELPELADALANNTDYSATPTTFFVVRQADAEQQAALISSFVAATITAVDCLQHSKTAWQALADEGALDGTHLDALRHRWQQRIGAFHPTSLSRSTL